MGAKWKRKKRIKLGDIYAIPLPDGKYAFGRAMKDAGIDIYKDISNNPHDIPTVEEYQFIVGLYRDVLQSGEWQIVDNRKFNSEEEAWPPKTYIKDVINGEYSRLSQLFLSINNKQRWRMVQVLNLLILPIIEAQG